VSGDSPIVITMNNNHDHMYSFTALCFSSSGLMSYSLLNQNKHLLWYYSKLEVSYQGHSHIGWLTLF